MKEKVGGKTRVVVGIAVAAVASGLGILFFV